MTDLGTTIGKIKPPKPFTDLVKFMESKYKCSGMCNKQLFYLTLDVTEGIPTQPCLRPYFEDLMYLLYQVGATMVSSAVFFLLMVFFVCPLCCKSNDNTTTTSKVEQFTAGAANNEGGVIEMELNKFADKIGANHQ